MTAFSDETGREHSLRCSNCGQMYRDFAPEDGPACECDRKQVQQLKAALSASPVAQEPVAWQLRQCPRVFWTSWRRCSREDYELVQKTGVFGDAPAQSRQLFPSSPPATPAGLGADEIARHGIYIASKTKHADRWRFLRDKVGEPIISTWIDEAGEGESSDLHDLWRRCLTEASSCQVLIAYREKDEVLKGGWVEIGAALSSGIPVYAVGLEEFTIAKYRGITHFPDMKSAIAASRSILALLSRGSGSDQAKPHEA